jgi:hypothetical protein
MLKPIRGLDLPRREYRDGGTKYVEIDLVA